MMHSLGSPKTARPTRVGSQKFRSAARSVTPASTQYTQAPRPVGPVREDITMSRTQIADMQQQTEVHGGELMDQVVDTFKDAVESGVKIQSNMARWWSDVMGQEGLGHCWHNSATQMLQAAGPSVKENAQQYLRLMDQGCQSARDLLRKAIDSAEYRLAMDAPFKAQELWFSALNIMRENLGNMTRATAQTLNHWAEICRQNIHEAAEHTREMPEPMTRPANRGNGG